MKIEILGVPCPQCELATEVAKRAVAALKIEADVIHVPDLARILDAGVMMTPGLFINGKEKCQGRVPSVDEIIAWIREETP